MLRIVPRARPSLRLRLPLVLSASRFSTRPASSSSGFLSQDVDFRTHGAKFLERTVQSYDKHIFIRVRARRSPFVFAKVIALELHRRAPFAGFLRSGKLTSFDCSRFSIPGFRSRKCHPPFFVAFPSSLFFGCKALRMLLRQVASMFT